MKIIEYAVKYKVTVYVLVLIFAVTGLMSYRSIPLEEVPEIDIPFIIVSTVYAGVAPEDMERLVTNPLEKELRSLKDVKEMTSTSAESVSSVVIEFETGVDTDDAYQKVRDKVDTAMPDLPEDAEDPVLIEVSTSDFPIMILNVMGDYDPRKLKAVSDRLKEKIEAVPGVLEVKDVGGLEREIQVYLDPHKLEHYKLGVGQVINRIGQEHLNMPAGSIDLGDTKYTVRVPAEYKDVSKMEDIVLKAPGGKSVKLGDVGRVVDGYADVETYSRADGVDCVTLRITKRAGENVVEVNEDIKSLLEKEKQDLPPGTSFIVSTDQSKQVLDMLGTLENSIITGLLLVLLVLFFAMGIRNSSFVALAIPLSMLIAVTVIHMLGFTMNMVVMFGLILALGMLVDNSIVVIENIYRHASEGKSKSEAAIQGTREVAWPIVTSTLTTVAAFLPLIFWPGIMGEFFGYLPKTVIIVLVATLFVALVVNPSLASSLLKTGGKKLFDDSGHVTSWYMKFYKAVLEKGLDNPVKVMAGALLVLVVTIGFFGAFNAGVEFMPSTTPERSKIVIETPQGTRAGRTDEYVHKAEALAAGDENVDFVIGSTGIDTSRFSFGGGSSNSHSGVVDIEFLPHAERKSSSWRSIERYRKELASLAGAEVKVEAEEMGPPTGEAVSVELSGPDYKVLSELAARVRELVESVPGAVDVEDDFESGKPEIKIEIDREQAMLRGVNTASIAQAVRTAINGTVAGVLREGDDEYDIVVRYEKEYRASVADVEGLMVTGRDDAQIPLSDVARVYTSGGKGSINHIDRKRTVLITSDVSGRSSTEVMMDVKALLGKELFAALGIRGPLHRGGRGTTGGFGLPVQGLHDRGDDHVHDPHHAVQLALPAGHYPGLRGHVHERGNDRAPCHPDQVQRHHDRNGHHFARRRRRQQRHRADRLHRPAPRIGAVASRVTGPRRHRPVQARDPHGRHHHARHASHGGWR